METLTINELIKSIENLGIYKDDGTNKHVVFDFCTAIPTDFDSWRGDYSLLAIGYKMTGRDDNTGLQRVTAKEFLQLCKDCIGKTFTGYKGSEFIMNKNSSVWVDNYGSYTQTGLVSVESDEYNIYLNTARVEY